MRIGDPKDLTPAPLRRYKSPAEDLFDAVASEFGDASIATRFALATALENGTEYLRLPSDVRRLFENVARQFGIAD